MCGYTALDYAVFEGQSAVVRFLLDKEPASDDKPSCVVKDLHLALSLDMREKWWKHEKYDETIDVLLDNIPNDVITPLIVINLIKKVFVKSFKRLISRGVSVKDISTQDGLNLLHCAVVFVEPNYLINSKNCEIVKLLIDAGVDVTQKNSNGQTPAEFARRKSDICYTVAYRKELLAVFDKK